MTAIPDKKHLISDPATIHSLIARRRHWYHRIELAPGIVTPGSSDSPSGLKVLDGLGLPADCTGLRVLDIGCRDGYYAFEMEKRGAEVVGIDHVAPTRTGFHIASTILDSHVTYLVENVYDLSPHKHGHFDVVLFLGVLYHLRNPMLALDQVRSILKLDGLLFVETQLLDNYIPRKDDMVTTLEEIAPQMVDLPIWQLHPHGLRGDRTNKWTPNMSALKSALEMAQFDVIDSIIYGERGLVRAKAIIDDELERYRRLDYGTGIQW